MQDFDRTSPYSGWVEERSLLNGVNKWVAEALEDIRVSLPFPQFYAPRGGVVNPMVRALSRFM